MRGCGHQELSRLALGGDEERERTTLRWPTGPAGTGQGLPVESRWGVGEVQVRSGGQGRQDSSGPRTSCAAPGPAPVGPFRLPLTLPQDL